MKEPMTTIVTNGPINHQLIPGYELNSLTRSVITAVRKYFEDPTVQADFERWRREEAAKTQAAATVT